jgi:hypothetical protein
MSIGLVSVLAECPHALRSGEKVLRIEQREFEDVILARFKAALLPPLLFLDNEVGGGG